MIGFVLGTACLVGLVMTLRSNARRQWRRSFGGEFSSAGVPYGPGGEDAGENARARWMFRWLFMRLSTTSGQEKVFIQEWETLRASLRQGREELTASRRQLADLMRAPSLEAGAFDTMFARQDVVMAEMRKAVAAALEHIHAALDDGQRRILATMVESGGAYGHGFGHGHHHGHHHWRHAHGCA